MNLVEIIIKDIDVFVGRDPASLDLFTMAIEKEWGTRLLLAKEIYHSEPVYLEREIASELNLLDLVKQRYLASEEFERCGRIQSLQERLKSENGIDLFITEFIKRNNIIS